MMMRSGQPWQWMESFFVSLTTYAHLHTTLTRPSARRGGVRSWQDWRGSIPAATGRPLRKIQVEMTSFVEMTSLVKLSIYIIQITHQETTHAHKLGYIHSPCTQPWPRDLDNICKVTYQTTSTSRQQHTFVPPYLVGQSTRQSSPYYKHPYSRDLIPESKKREFIHSLVPASTMSFLQVYLPTYVPP